MSETQLAELADQVSKVLEERGTPINPMALVGEVVLIGGASYMVIKTVQRIRTRRWLRKHRGCK